MNKIKWNIIVSKSIINKLINIENIRLVPGWRVNIAVHSLWHA